MDKLTALICELDKLNGSIPKKLPKPQCPQRDARGSEWVAYGESLTLWERNQLAWQEEAMSHKRAVLDKTEDIRLCILDDVGMLEHDKEDVFWEIVRSERDDWHERRDFANVLAHLIEF